MVIWNWHQKLTLQALDLHPSLSRECLVRFLDSLGRRSIACNASFLVSDLTMVDWLFQLEVQKSPSNSFSRTINVMFTSPSRNVNLGIFTSSSDDREMHKKGWCTCRVACEQQTYFQSSLLLLFLQYKPIVFLPFSLTSPLSLLKLPITGQTQPFFTRQEITLLRSVVLRNKNSCVWD